MTGTYLGYFLETLFVKGQKVVNIYSSQQIMYQTIFHA